MINTYQDINKLNDEEYSSLLKPLWDYLGVYDEPRKTDLIFVFGGLDLAVPRRAAELYTYRLASQVLISGSWGPFTQGVFTKSEAAEFCDEMVRHGTPREAILLEEKAINTLENVLFGMDLLRKWNVRPASMILVGKTFLMRRCKATFERQFPEIAVRCCPPLTSILEAVDRDRERFAKRLVDELQRLQDYGEKGDIVLYQLPSKVRQRSEDIRALLIKSH